MPKSNLEFLAYEETALGPICLRRRKPSSLPGVVVTEVTLNHEFLMSSYLTESERALSSTGVGLALENPHRPQENANGLRVLIGGLGLGYTAAEALKFDQVDSVEVVEFLPEVIGWMQYGLIPLSAQLNAEPRLTVTLGDVYARVTARATLPYDLIAIDVDHSPEDVLGTQSHGFYTVNGLQRVSNQLTPGGVLAIWSYAEDTPLLDTMKQVFDDVQTQQVTVMNDLINEEQTDWLFFGRRRANAANSAV